MSVLLRLNSVAHFYGPRLIFKEVSLAVRRHSVTLLAGANGAGKSTLLKIMAGLIRPAAGEVVPAQRVELNGGLKIGYLGHQTFIYPELTAAENLHFWVRMHGKAFGAEDCLEALRRVELDAFAEEKAGAFSRGMAQRLSLARVFLLEPDLLLLDEPATGLDVRSTGILYRELEAAKSTGAGIVWVTHSLESDLGRADAVAVLHNKQLRLYDPASSFSVDAPGSVPQKKAPTVLADPPETRSAQGGDLC